ncbi:MAG: hypothetical protein HY820_08590 [Acidobacteria bacterium]|nr:hypothetical protein [Acidobacteriota bacterium]
MNGDNINYFKAAFLWQYNLILLGGAAALSLVSQSALPLLLASGLELMYLSLVPNNARFQRMVRAHLLSDQRRAKANESKAILRALPIQVQERFDAVSQTGAEIKSNYAASASSTQWISSPLEQRLDHILDGYVRLLHAAHLQANYLSNADPSSIDRDLAKVKKENASATARVKEINDKRIDILTRRLEKFQKIRESFDVTEAQLAATEDVLKLIRDQSITMRDPQQISAQLDTLVQGVEQTEQTMKEMESIVELAAMDPGLDTLPPDSRDRLRS